MVSDNGFRERGLILNTTFADLTSGAPILFLEWSYNFKKIFI